MTAIAYDAGSPGLRLDLIIRTSKRKKEAKSPGQQREIAESSVKANGHQIVFTHDSGTDESGKTMNRASINAAMKRVQSGQTDGVIVALADRIGRAPIEEAMATVRAFCSTGKLVIADMGGQPLDLSEGVTETNVVMQLQFARQYWLATAKRTRQSREGAVKAGKFVGPTPIGYRREKGRLYEHPRCGPIMRQAYKLAALEDLHVAARYLQKMIPERNWTTDYVRQVLASKAYKGWSTSGEFVNKQAHAALAEPGIWEAAQTDPRARRTNGDYPLTGLAQCGECGGPMTGWLQTVPAMRRRKDDWRRYEADHSKPKRTYRRMRCGDCARCAILADDFEGYVRDALKGPLANLELRRRFGDVDLPGAQAALSRACAARDDFADDLEAQDAYGRDGSLRRAAALAKRVDECEAAYQQAVIATTRAEMLPGPDELDDPVKLVRAVRAMIRTITVLAGRGTLDDRIIIVPLTPDDLDD